MAKKTKDEYLPTEGETEVKGHTPEEELNKFLKDNESEHLNFFEEVNYKVSTGSLNLDYYTGGGLTPGLHRMTGCSESGKSSASLEIMRNFLATVPNSRGVYIKSEGRLSREVRGRSGIVFTTKAEEWKDGTVFILETNVYETSNALMKTLVFNNPFNKRYMFIIDSMDALLLKNDVDKKDGEENKVAGGALLTSDLMKRVALRLTKLGHLAVFISQVRSTIQIDQKTKREFKATNASGGHAVTHYANWVFEFQPNFFGGSLILEDPEVKTPHPITNKIIGHWVKINIRKSTNEITGQSIEYPIKHGQTNGSSIWKEYEVFDMMLVFEHLKKEGAWLKANSDSSLIKDIITQFKEFPEKFNGQAKFLLYLEKNKEVMTYLYDRFKKLVSAS